MALCPGLPGWAGTRKIKRVWILLKQETASGSGISWAICKSAPHSRQITTSAPHNSVFYRPDALPAAQPTASKHWRQKHWPITVWQKCVVFKYSFVCVSCSFSVEACTDVFTSVDSLLEHLWICNLRSKFMDRNSDQFVCLECGKSYKGEKCTYNHVLKCHQVYLWWWFFVFASSCSITLKASYCAGSLPCLPFTITALLVTNQMLYHCMWMSSVGAM